MNIRRFGSLKWARLPLLATGLALSLGSAGVASASDDAAPAAARPSNDVTIAIGGDLLGPYRPVGPLNDPGFTPVKRIMADADAAFANFEASAFDLASFEGWPASENGGGTPLFSPAAVADLATWIDAVSVANNHATDWGLAGMIETRKTLRQAGIVTAGSGESEADARAPVYFTRGATRIGFVAAASTFTKLSMPAGPGQKEGVPTRPRPGINIVRNSEVWLAPRAVVDGLRALGTYSFAPKPPANGAQLGSQTFRVGEGGRAYAADEADVAKVVASVAEAGKNSDLVVFSIHAHETATGDSEDPRPAPFQQELFHRLVDAGADLIYRHGPHATGGIEIYKGRPILYGMGSLVFAFGGAKRLTFPGDYVMEFPDTWFEGAAITATYRKGNLRELRVHPLILESSKKATDGLPSLATGADARRILGRIQRDSAQWGTRLEIRGDVGVIHAPRPAS